MFPDKFQKQWKPVFMFFSPGYVQTHSSNNKNWTKITGRK